MRPWLLGIARHVALDARRARVRARLRQSDDDESSALDKVETLLPDPHEQAVLAERSVRLQRALDTLPVTQRRALSLHADGLGYREISVELKVPLGSVCTWIARGRQTLARALAETEEASPEILGEAGHNSSEATS